MIISKKGTIFGRMHRFQDFTFETSEAFGIMNIQIQFITFFPSQRKERIFEITMFYFEMKYLRGVNACNISTFSGRNNVK